MALPRALVNGLVVAAAGLLFSLLPLVQDLEESLDLGLLFRLRGPRPAPRDVAVVAVDRESADRLEVPDDPEEWPRRMHARLIERLHAAGARAIVFDLLFEKPQGETQDQPLAAALRQAGNVVLAAYLKRDALGLADPDGLPRGEIVVERLELPLANLHLAARGAAPFPLPQIPVRANQCWTFKASAGDAPTLPVAALQVLAFSETEAWLRLQGILAEAGFPGGGALPRTPPELDDQLRRLRTHLAGDPALGRAVLARLNPPAATGGEEPAAGSGRAVQALVRACAGPGSFFLNFVGPPGSVATIPYHQALEGPADRLRRDVAGRVVFVGCSERFRQEQRDGFHTVYSGSGRPDLSGVEIAATALDNLLRDEALQPLDPWAYGVLIGAWGLLLGFLGRRLAPVPAAAVTVILAGGYLALAVFRFGAAQWWPFTIPVLVQAPLALVAGLAGRYVEVNRERGRIRAAFGLYLPDPVVDQIARSLEHVRQEGQEVYGVCLITDAERYTTFSETVDPAELGRFMNRFYEAIFEPVRSHGGIITDVVGDSMMAVWTSASANPELKERACRAALAILRAVDRFNRQEQGFHLPVRIGLHAGPVMVGHIGALDHFEYRAVGDVVNTASRIENLNKPLGTRILASRSVLDGLTGFRIRTIGRFRLAGKSLPIALAELQGEAAADADAEAFGPLFDRGRAALENRQWSAAEALFAACLQLRGDDGPSVFLLETCRRLREGGAGERWDGVLEPNGK